jgi:WXG100 family type VII secretion target
MSAEVIQSKYEELETIAHRFGQQAQTTRELQRRVQRGADALRHGGWQGRGVVAFSGEMEQKVFPAMQRLTEALTQAQVTTLQVKAIIQQAEEEASSVFRESGYEPARTGAEPTIPSVSLGSNPSDGSIWDYVRVKGELWKIDPLQNGAGGRNGKFDPEIKLTVGIKESAIWGDPKKDGWAGIGGFVEAGARATLKDPSVMIGAGGEFYVAKGKWDTALVGDKEYGITGGVEVKAASVEGFAGVQFDGDEKRIGATVGANLISVGGEVGGNVAGYNVGVTGEVGLKAELGFEAGTKGVKVKLPLFTVGIKFGEGVD